MVRWDPLAEGDKDAPRAYQSEEHEQNEEDVETAHANGHPKKQSISIGHLQKMLGMLMDNTTQTPHPPTRAAAPH